MPSRWENLASKTDDLAEHLHQYHHHQHHQHRHHYHLLCKMDCAWKHTFIHSLMSLAQPLFHIHLHIRRHIPRRGLHEHNGHLSWLCSTKFVHAAHTLHPNIIHSKELTLHWIEIPCVAFLFIVSAHSLLGGIWMQGLVVLVILQNSSIANCLPFPVYLCGGCFLVLFLVIGNSLEDRAMLWNAGKSHPGDRKDGRGLPSWKTDASGVWWWCHRSCTTVMVMVASILHQWSMMLLALHL